MALWDKISARMSHTVKFTLWPVTLAFSPRSSGVHSLPHRSFHVYYLWVPFATCVDDYLEAAASWGLDDVGCCKIFWDLSRLCSALVSHYTEITRVNFLPFLSLFHVPIVVHSTLSILSQIFLTASEKGEKRNHPKSKQKQTNKYSKRERVNLVQ